MIKKYLLRACLIVLASITVTNSTLLCAQTPDQIMLNSINALVLDSTQLASSPVYTAQLTALSQIMTNAQNNVYTSSTQNSFASALIEIFNCRSGQTNDALQQLAGVLVSAQSTPLFTPAQQDYVKGMYTILGGEITIATTPTSTEQKNSIVKNIEKTQEQLKKAAQDAAKKAQQAAERAKKFPSRQQITSAQQPIILPQIRESSIVRRTRAVITEKQYLRGKPQQ